ncbi:unnamed protein product, partial [Dovyalis caffra]
MEVQRLELVRLKLDNIWISMRGNLWKWGTARDSEGDCVDFGEDGTFADAWRLRSSELGFWVSWIFAKIALRIISSEEVSRPLLCLVELDLINGIGEFLAMGNGEQTFDI